MPENYKLHAFNNLKPFLYNFVTIKIIIIIFKKHFQILSNISYFQQPMGSTNDQPIRINVLKKRNILDATISKNTIVVFVQLDGNVKILSPSKISHNVKPSIQVRKVTFYFKSFCWKFPGINHHNLCRIYRMCTLLWDTLVFKVEQCH